MIICQYDKCTGCGTCANACPDGCIDLKEDRYGELHPSIKTSKCSGCGLCIQACPNNKKPKLFFPQKCFASWLNDKAKRSTCASGGIATIIAEFVVKHKKGVVFGTAYDESLNPRTIFTDNISDIETFKGSKYVQSVISNSTFKDVEQFLKSGRFVVYIGTPCQIAGLITYLKVEYSTLITVDLICHGVSPTAYYRAELQHLSKRYKLKNLSNVRFRGNDGMDYRTSFIDRFFPVDRTNFCLSLWSNERGKPILKYSRDSRHSEYLAGFLLGVTLRESCYSCDYAKPERVADITLGDFIELGKHKPFAFKTTNVSSVTLNSNKGNAFYKEVAAIMPDLVNIERDYKERLEYKPSLIHPFARHPLTSQFRELYVKVGFPIAIRKTLKKSLRQQRFWHNVSHLISSARKILRSIGV